MREFNDSTLWRISAYERFRAENGHSGFSTLNGSTILPSTLAAELTTLEYRRRSGDVVDVLAACIRKRESALILLRHRDLVWPLTVFPQNGLYHLPRPIIEALDDGTRGNRAAQPPPGASGGGEPLDGLAPVRPLNQAGAVHGRRWRATSLLRNSRVRVRRRAGS